MRHGFSFTTEPDVNRVEAANMGFRPTQPKRTYSIIKTKMQHKINLFIILNKHVGAKVAQQCKILVSQIGEGKLKTTK